LPEDSPKKTYIHGKLASRVTRCYKWKHAQNVAKPILWQIKYITSNWKLRLLASFSNKCAPNKQNSPNLVTLLASKETFMPYRELWDKMHVSNSHQARYA
jgi:hypothetical protein